MGKKKEKKQETSKKIEKEASFDYKKYVEETFERPKAFLYYILVNDLTFKSKEEVDKAYELYNL
jgi:hypothetical protein